MSLFRRKLKPDAEGFVDTAVPAAQVVADMMRAVRVNGRAIVLTRWEEVVYAFRSTCPHAAADLGGGSISRWKVTCPDHGYCFDVRNGRILWPEDEFYRLTCYEAKEANGTIHVKLD